MKKISAKLLRIYLKEEDRYGKELLINSIIKTLKNNGIAGATVFKGFCGYGTRGFSRIDILRLSMNLPAVIECIDYEEKLNDIMPKLVEMVSENGLITIQDIDVFKELKK
ncbi:hypothetical protein HNP87_000452 [Methanococcus maripaludis]|uniref:DUF190 domain-containing protein n=1 Tax=Methanococcus maripaludis TaxID=39152 RepID=A0A7J9NHE8_METMI|nr:DUF190 domain-containing protein [Methanococcus maripaludis]MBA2839940.1 hypothetical protein [Methanococcus maripaludis]MBA2852517.1 hypothetical protein [Methanococcus maripaludis]MBA2859658.1 hypothetical protein [Methanococcus maripaludis]MBA2868295.1 hypothetical protein [Methanococcus maripaludis]MBB6401131.1 hypothetical protein [Methanococcus maripaludis]